MKDLLNLPFDQYQRYRDVKEIISVLKNNKPLKVLDVGGYPGIIDDFLPDEHTTILDVQPMKGKKNYVQGDGSKLPFGHNSFDLVCSLDTLEHVEPEKREKFLEELVRASKDYVILIAPFDDEDVKVAEEITYQFYLRTFQAELQILKEHLENGLPLLKQVKEFFSNRGFSVETIPSGYLYNWLPMQIAKIYVQSLPDSQELHRLLDRFYNQNFYEADHKQPSYRTIIIASKKKSNLSAVEQRFRKLEVPKNKKFFGDFNMLMALLNLKHQNQMQILAKELEQIHQLLKEKDVHITNLEAIIRGKEEHIRNLEDWVAKVQKSIPYRVYAKAKGVGRKR